MSNNLSKLQITVV